MKKTQKAMTALKIAEFLGIDTSNIEKADKLYDILTDRSYLWDTKEKEWNYIESLPPTEKIAIRVMSGGKERVTQYGQRVSEALKNAGFRIIGISELYRNRPPNNHDYRLYIECLKEGEN